jgi:uncharacterized protein
MSDSKIWVLIDNRIGNANQALALANRMGMPFEVKNIQCNKFAKLPNFILSLYPIHVKRSVLTELKSEELPDIIISSGRRTAVLALYLKKISNNKCKIIQIMRPDADPNQFAAIILPQHDKYNYISPNVIRIIGALTDVGSKIPFAKADFARAYSDVKNFVAVIIGGSNKKYSFTLKNAKELSDKIRIISETQRLSLFITFSRRTPKKVKKYFQEKFPLPNICYDPEESVEKNPYPAILEEARFIITTTDSISMCSEAASTGRPIYVYQPKNFHLKKHKFFIQQLVDLGIARRIDEDTRHLKEYKYTPLSEVRRVVEIIQRDILKKQY